MVRFKMLHGILVGNFPVSDTFYLILQDHCRRMKNAPPSGSANELLTVPSIALGALVMRIHAEMSFIDYVFTRYSQLLYT